MEYDATFVKDPDAVKDYTRDWTPFLAGDTIATSSWLAPAGITIDSDTHNASTATVWLSGGTARLDYRVTNRITTAGGRTEDRTLLITVKEQ